MIDFTLEDLLQWDELSPSLQKKFNMMTKEEIENFFKDGGFLDDLMKKYTFLNLPPKIGYGKNTTIDIDLGENSEEYEKLNGVLITTRPGMFFLRHNKKLVMFNYGVRYDISDDLSSIETNVSYDDETRFNYNFVVCAQEDIIFIAYNDVIQMVKLNGSWKRKDWAVTDISRIISGIYKAYVNFQFSQEWYIHDAYCFYWEDVTKSYIVVTVLQPHCTSAYYGDDTYMKIDVFDKNLNLIKSERIASLWPKNNKNQFIPSLGDVLLAFDSIFFTYDSKRKLLFIGGSAIYWADYKEKKERREYSNITPLLTYKDFDIVKYCTDVNYKLSSTLVTNVDYISESNFNFIDLTAIASTEIKKDFTNNFKRVNLTYDSVTDKYYLSQVAKYNIDGYLHIIDKIDMNNIKSGWSIFNMDSITPKYFLRTYHSYEAYKIIKFVDRNNIPNNIYDAKEPMEILSNRFYYNEIGNYVVLDFLAEKPKNFIRGDETMLIKNPIFNADRTINYKKSSIGSFRFHSTTIYDEYGVQTSFLFRHNGGPSFHSSTESKELYKGKFISRKLFAGVDQEDNKFVIRYSLIPNENDIKYPLITPYDKFYHYDNYYDGGGKMFILEDAIPELKNKKEMRPLYGIPLYNGIAYIAVRYNDNDVYIYSINVNTLSYTKAKLEESLKIYSSSNIKLIDSKLYLFNISGYAYDGGDNSLYELNKIGDKYVPTKYRKFLENIAKITGLTPEICDIAKNSRYGYMMTVICYKGYDTIDRLIVISTKDTIGNGTEYTWDQMIKEDKFYYEIYTKDIIETRFNTMDVLYRRKTKNVTPQKPGTGQGSSTTPGSSVTPPTKLPNDFIDTYINTTEVTYRKSIRVPVQGSTSAPTPTPPNPTPPSTTPALPPSSTSEEYRIVETNTGIGEPPFIMSDDDGNINMWNIVRDDSYRPYGIYKSVKKPGEDNFTFIDKKVKPACFEKMGAEVIGILGIQYEAIHVKVKRKDNGREIVEWYTILTYGSSDPNNWNKCINITNIIKSDSNCAIYYTAHYMVPFFPPELTKGVVKGTWIVLRNCMYDKFVIDMYDKNQNKTKSELVCYGRSSANYTWALPNIPYNYDKPNTISPKCLMLFVDEQQGVLSAGIRLNVTPVGSTTTKSAFLLFEYNMDNDIDKYTHNLRRATNMNIYNITKTNDLTFGWGLTPDTQPLIMLSGSFDSYTKTYNIVEMTVSGINSSPVQSSTYIRMHSSPVDMNFNKGWTRYPWGNSEKGVYNLYAYTKSTDKPPVADGKSLSLNYNLLDLRVYGKCNIAKVDHGMGSNFKGKYLLINPSKMTLRPVRRVLFSLGSIKCITDELIDKKWKDAETKFGFDINTNARSWSTNGYEGIFHMINFDSNGKSVKELNTGTVKYSKINDSFALPVPNTCKKISSTDTNLNTALFTYTKGTNNLSGAAIGVGPDGTGYMLRTRKYNNLYAYDIVTYDSNGTVISVKCIDIQNLTLHDSSSSTYHPDKTSVGKSNESDTSNIYYNFKLEPILPNLVIDGTDIYLFVNIINTSLNSTDIRASGEPYFIKLSLIRDGLYYEPKQLIMLSKYLSGFYYEPKAGKQIKQFGYNERYGWFIVIKEPFGDYSGGNTAFIIISSKDTLEKGRSLSANEFWNGMDGYAEIYINEPTHVHVDDVINSIEDASSPPPVLPPAPKIEELTFTIKPIPVFLGGYYTDFAGASGKLIDNAMNYIYLYRDKVKWREVKVEVTKTPHWAPPMKNNKPYSDPLKFDKVLVATILVKNKNIVNKTLYPVGDNYLYLNFNINH